MSIKKHEVKIQANLLGMTEEHVRKLLAQINDMKAQELGFIQTLCVQSEETKELRERIKELEAALWVAYQDSGTPNDYDVWMAALLREQGE